MSAATHVVVVEIDVVTNGTCDQAQDMVEPYLDRMQLGGVRVVEVFETKSGIDKRIPTKPGFYYCLIDGEETILEMVAVKTTIGYDMQVVDHPEWNFSWEDLDWQGAVPSLSEQQELRRMAAKEEQYTLLLTSADPRVQAAPSDYLPVTTNGAWTGYFVHCSDLKQVAWNPPAGTNRGVLNTGAFHGA